MKDLKFTDRQLETITNALRIYTESLKAKLINDPCGTAATWVNGQIANCGEIDKLIKSGL